MSAKLRIAKNLALPMPAAVTKKLAFLGISGSGKTYGACMFVEQLLDAGAQTVVIDNVGNWWGLRLAQDGKSKGYEIYLLGGERADVPLEPTGGALAADTLVDTGVSAILDVSDFTEGEKRRFITDFAKRLLERRKQKPGAMQVVWEECHEIVPQRVFGPDAQMVGAVERLVKRGRNYGIGTTLISQRPEAVNKDVLNQAEVLFAFQTNGKQERLAIRAWMESKHVDQDVLLELASLPTGDAFAWSPSWLRIFERVHFLPKKTFDSSATPEFGASEATLQKVAPLDVARLSEAMKATIERAKVNDPEELRRQLREVRALLEQERQRAARAESHIKTETKEILVIKDDQIKRLEAMAEKLIAELGAVRVELARVAAPTPRVAATPAQMPRASSFIVPKPIVVTPADGLSRPQQRMLDVLETFYRMGVSQVYRSATAVLSDQSPRSSSTGNNFGALRSRGLISYPNSAMVEITAEGRRLAHEVAPWTLAQLHDAWKRVLPGPQGRMLDVLALRFPRPLGRGELAEATAQSFKSSSFGNNLGAMRSLGIVDYPDSASVVATRELFPEGAR